MIIVRTSEWSGIRRFCNIPIDPQDYQDWFSGSKLIQHAAPYLSDADRQFVISGMTMDEFRESRRHYRQPGGE